MPKGHSLLEPRIKALEDRLANLQQKFEAHVLTSFPPNIMDRLAALEGVKDPALKPKVYQSAFDKWPGNGSSP